MIVIYQRHWYAIGDWTQGPSHQTLELALTACYVGLPSQQVLGYLLQASGPKFQRLPSLITKYGSLSRLL